MLLFLSCIPLGLYLSILYVSLLSSCNLHLLLLLSVYMVLVGISPLSLSCGRFCQVTLLAFLPLLPIFPFLFYVVQLLVFLFILSFSFPGGLWLFLLVAVAALSACRLRCSDPSRGSVPLRLQFLSLFFLSGVPAAVVLIVL